MKQKQIPPTVWWGETRKVKGYSEWFPPTWAILLKLYFFRLLIDIGMCFDILANKERLDEFLYRFKLEKIMGKKRKYFGGHDFNTDRDYGGFHSQTSSHTTTSGHFGGNKTMSGHKHKARIPMADVPKERKVVPGQLPKPGNLNRVCSRCSKRRVGDNRFGDCDFCKQNHKHVGNGDGYFWDGAWD